MRLGLANLPLLLGLELLEAPAFFLLVLVKVLGQALVNGTLASYVFLFSVCGSAAAGGLMFLCRRGFKNRISLWGISMMGALASNGIQGLLAVFFIFGPLSRPILPLFLGAGLLSSSLIAWGAMNFQRRSLWWQELRTFTKGTIPHVLEESSRREAFEKTGDEETDTKRQARKKVLAGLCQKGISDTLRFKAGLLLLPAYLFIDHLLLKGGLTLLFGMAALCMGRKLRPLPLLSLLFSVLFFHILNPAGLILYRFGPVVITEGALKGGLFKALTLWGMIFLSLASVSRNLKFPGTLGGLLSLTIYRFEEILEGKQGLKTFRETEGKKEKTGGMDFILKVDRILLERFPLATLMAPGASISFGQKAPLPEDASGRRAALLYVLILVGAAYGGLLWQLLML